MHMNFINLMAKAKYCSEQAETLDFFVWSNCCN